MSRIISCNASGQYQNYAPENAIDGNPATVWNSGGHAPQWIVLTLDKPQSKLRLTWINEMSPLQGYVDIEFHLISDNGELLKTISKTYYCETGGANHIDLDDCAKVKRIGMTFTKSPSWIALREVMVS